MAQRSLFFNDTESEQRVYFAEDEARYNYLMMAGQGIAKQGDYEAYEIAPKQNMVVTIGAGAAFIKGYLHEVYDTAEELELDAADPTNDRIDRIVLRFINVTTEREIRLEVLKGTPSANPVPPSVTRTNDTTELSLAQIKVISGKSFIEPSQITDEKNNPLVCGYSPLHNLLRGVQVDEGGLVAMPNQSYVEVDINDTPFNTPDRQRVRMPITPIKIDRQNEINHNNEFVAKSSGSYNIFVYLAYDEADMQSASDVQVLYNVNDISQGPVLARVSVNNRDNVFAGSTIQYLEAGDKLTLDVWVIGAPASFQTRNHRVRIAKLN